MNKKLRTKHGLTLMEMVVVVSVVAVFTVLGVPAIRALFRSIEAEGGAKAMISAALSTARAIAAREQHYAGIRFQNKYQEDGRGCQYMIFIVNDTEIGPGKPGNLGCRAVEGIQPIKLPDSVGVMEVVSGNGDIVDSEVTNKTTFSIVFSPSGKLVIHELWVRNRDGDTGNGSKDDIFNTLANINNNTEPHGMFLQDGEDICLQIEPSRNSFIIYDKGIFEKTDENSRYDDYLKDLEVVYINPYTGTMINK
jgi:prepilin-type N-terminal cleavage/methylation domain-containing protein